ncbi:MULTISPECIES: XRE family transcriptional regulator [unclassified Bradyrhizobium]|uniref:XRE family transcriptional regulator n=1 Tax=unclassified Bradyrhizobium TaxID=2631580 RepID=UPI0020B1D82E|nr:MULTISPECIES: XRE family transcriptional regulator [unclassified Bradyrhizobium]MCP3380622.1 XRE family transcriptional regulator [Bradyrhizobium sp. CCGUVB4N]MCP3441490.1 XRE family transcriptional regulator [Bradyrhizobium sp. CCGUVB14]
MVALNKLTKAPPHVVAKALVQLGADLRTARIRRNMTMEDAASRIGTGLRAVMDAEKGKASTGIVVYAGLLWLYDMIRPLEELADPSKDKEGLALQATRERKRARKGGGLDNDF